MKILINHSNHPSGKWDDTQKRDWSAIYDIAFPNVPPSASVQDVQSLVHENVKKILQIIKDYDSNNDNVYIMVQGEYTYTILFCKEIAKFPNWQIAIPTTERVTQEVQKDGSIEKISIFKFAGWRILPANG